MIEVDAVRVVSGDVTLLDTITRRVDAGTALAVRGGNGSGKTTLLRVLAGMQAPSAGSARIAGAAISQRDRRYRRRVAAMIGLPPFAPDLTVLEHVRLVAVTWFAPAEAETRARAVLSELGLQTLHERFPHELSSGQTQLFGLALVLVRPCDVLLLDEPEQRLDPEHVDAVIAALRARRDAGVTLVVATHHPRLAQIVADETVYLERVA
ncbi:ABC-type multidrug transport system ATPase subunit [Microbacterium sp. SORGH_AS428]|uniref:ABC transporter ATP-binding protein n=1 Tax=Microbacterium sp. SORGH_AS_0428 TaxID=3041788 RepID=UPI002862A3B6|nr:ABC transporter ATP-binding protein [Microbacterium sp. SORGH_AS_0428]MDR6199394.1 ABC-type multidrug transport system ATPase subunit [Microbacterium sp. SORGH_AS_0428]